jgi:TolA-binding protein
MNAHAGDLTPVETDPLEHAGQSILALLQKASAIAEQNTQHAITAAHRLAIQLRASEDRIAELEASLRLERARAERAEEWLKRISHQIEQQLSAQSAGSTQPAPTPPQAPAPPQAPSSNPGIELYAKRRQRID